MKRAAQLLIGVLISVFFLYLIVPGLHLPDVWRAMGQANYWWIVPGVAVYMVGLWARTWRWHYMLRHLKPVSMGRLFPVVCIGYFGNNVYPFRAGEVMRAYVLWQREEIPISSSLATVIIERVFDGLVMLLFVFLALPFAPIPAAFQRFVVFVTFMLLIVTALFIWVTVRPRRIAALYGWLAEHLLPARIRERTDGLFETVHGGAGESAQRAGPAVDFCDEHRGVADGDGQVLVCDACVCVQCQFSGADVDERGGESGDDAAVGAGVHRDVRYAGDRDADGVRDRYAAGGELYVDAARGAVGAGDAAGGVLFLAGAAAVE